LKWRNTIANSASMVGMMGNMYLMLIDMAAPKMVQQNLFQEKNSVN